MLLSLALHLTISLTLDIRPPLHAAPVPLYFLTLLQGFRLSSPQLCVHHLSEYLDRTALPFTGSPPSFETCLHSQVSARLCVERMPSSMSTHVPFVIFMFLTFFHPPPPQNKNMSRRFQNLSLPQCALLSPPPRTNRCSKKKSTRFVFSNFTFPPCHSSSTGSFIESYSYPFKPYYHSTPARIV